MVNYHTQLVNTLNDILPTHYEMTLTSETKTPCISYMEINNYTTNQGDTLGYSKIAYQIKVWGNSIGLLQENALKIDEALRKIGFTRISTGELYDNQSSMIQKIMTFEALCKEDY